LQRKLFCRCSVAVLGCAGGNGGEGDEGDIEGDYEGEKGEECEVCGIDGRARSIEESGAKPVCALVVVQVGLIADREPWRTVLCQFVY
jgi:hypothetical protein